MNLLSCDIVSYSFQYHFKRFILVVSPLCILSTLTVECKLHDRFVLYHRVQTLHCLGNRRDYSDYGYCLFTNFCCFVIIKAKIFSLFQIQTRLEFDQRLKKWFETRLFCVCLIKPLYSGGREVLRSRDLVLTGCKLASYCLQELLPRTQIRDIVENLKRR